MSVEGKFLSKEINDLFWREGLTLVTAVMSLSLILTKPIGKKRQTLSGLS